MELTPHVMLVAVFGIIAASCQTDIQSGIDSANDLLYRKQYVASERLYRKLLKRLDNLGGLDDEEEAQRLLVLDRLGNLNALYLHDYDQAITYYQTLGRQYSKTDEAFAALATIADIHHHKLGDLPAAIAAYRELVGAFPMRTEIRRAQLQIANAYFQLKNYEQARAEAEQLINRWPKCQEAAEARFQIANSYYVQARYAEAIATYERLLEENLDPSLAALVLFELGNCFQELDQADRALAYYYACLKDHPDPILVQDRIRRVRTRLRNTRPLPEIQLPEYLRDRLATSARNQRPPAVEEVTGVVSESVFAPTKAKKRNPTMRATPGPDSTSAPDSDPAPVKPKTGDASTPVPDSTPAPSSESEEEPSSP